MCKSRLSPHSPWWPTQAKLLSPRCVYEYICDVFLYSSLTGFQSNSTIMPLLLNVLRNTNGDDYRKLRVKAMECTGLIGSSFVAISMICFYVCSCVAIAVGRDIFRPDENTLVELLMRIQSAFALFTFLTLLLMLGAELRRAVNALLTDAQEQLGTQYYHLFACPNNYRHFSRW
jgi:hypothetical protein